MSIHDGHRNRLKNLYRKEGLDSFEPVNVLELLLFYCVPRKDTNPLAHRLLDTFGSLPDVLEAKAEELEKVEGVSTNIATFLTMIPNITRYYLVQRSANEKVVRTTDECGCYLSNYFVGLTNETVYLLCMDAKGKVLCCREVGRGSVNAANISIRRIVEVVLSANATTAVLAHNHPGGLALPSAEDVQTTLRVASALRAVDVILADHLVFAGEDYVSLLQSGYYRPESDEMLV